MENKLHETGSVVEVELATPKSEAIESQHPDRKEPTQAYHRLGWTDPEASMKLVRWLMDIVNTQEEYELLERDLVELEAWCPSSSIPLKGGA